MTERLFLDDSRLTHAEARVVDAGDGGIVLDRTVFYARSGGQPGDCGVLRWAGHEARVNEAIKGEGEAIVHLVTANGELPSAGTLVEEEIDWERRYRLMRMHTMLHLLCSLLPGAGVTGGQLHEDHSRLDFALHEAPDRAALEERLNALIAANHAVSTEWVDASVLDASPELVRTLSVKPPRGQGRIRLVRIGAGDPPIDLQPCGGTHVAATGEIGRVVIRKIENKGHQNRRIVLAFAA